MYVFCSSSYTPSSSSHSPLSILYTFIFSFILSSSSSPHHLLLYIPPHSPQVRSSTFSSDTFLHIFLDYSHPRFPHAHSSTFSSSTFLHIFLDYIFPHSPQVYSRLLPFVSSSSSKFPASSTFFSCTRPPTFLHVHSLLPPFFAPFLVQILLFLLILLMYIPPLSPLLSVQCPPLAFALTGLLSVICSTVQSSVLFFNSKKEFARFSLSLSLSLSLLSLIHIWRCRRWP